jgi:hypothetical protein
MNHHTKNKGDLGVLKAQVDLFEKGYLILQPQTEHAPFDLVIYKDNNYKRVQVKYRSLTKAGILEVRLRSSYSTSKGCFNKDIDKQEIDVYCIYCPNTDKCYYFNPYDVIKSITLRVEAPKNNQMKNVKFLNDYREVP